jgi:hypothetical protein
MPADTKKTIARLYTLVAKLPLEAYLSSENFIIFCREHDLVDTWKEHSESAKDRPDLYGREAVRQAFILFFDHLILTRPLEFLGILAAFLQDLGEYSAHPVPVDAIKKACVRLGFPTNTVDDEFLKIDST